MEHKGFRGRWQNSSAAASATEPSAIVGDFPLSDAYNQWETVEPPEFSNLFGLPDGDVDDVAMEMDAEPMDVEEKAPRFMRPKPKISASKPLAPTSVSESIKRTADEMASTQVHRLIISDVKQPWQMGPLSSLFSKQTFLGTLATAEQDAASGALRSHHCVRCQQFHSETHTTN